MKNSLLFTIGIVILFYSGFNLSGAAQTVILTENFAGFISGTHTTPSTFDVSANLNTRTSATGWTGSKIYEAGGEIKLGTSSNPGWIETPSVDLSANGGNFILLFDIARWTDDVTTVQVYLNGTAIGSTIAPANTFQSVQIEGTGGTSSSKIMIQALTKRFYLDNLSITTPTITTIKAAFHEKEPVKLYPVPASDHLYLINILDVKSIQISDINGKIIKTIEVEDSYELLIPLTDLTRGIYFIKMKTGRGFMTKSFIKY